MSESEITTQQVTVEGVHSGCCNSEDYVERTTHHSIGPVWKSYKCAECEEPVSWGLNNGWELRESSAVFKDFDDKLWFASHFVSDPKTVKEMVEKGQMIVAPKKSLVTTLTGEWNRDGDTIPWSAHRSFMRKWKDKVENPKQAKVFE